MYGDARKVVDLDALGRRRACHQDHLGCAQGGACEVDTDVRRGRRDQGAGSQITPYATDQHALESGVVDLADVDADIPGERRRSVLDDIDFSGGNIELAATPARGGLRLEGAVKNKAGGCVDHEPASIDWTNLRDRNMAG